tara:strand:+ start:5057 stop:6082 length:1026 start_codon:yes stop_codon:yes gene_type:complete
MRDRYYDNTRIQEYRSCPRKFFFRHVVDWRGDGWSAPLVFGSSWHAAMDAIWPMLTKPNRGSGSKSQFDREEVVATGYTAFVDEWIEGGATHPDEMDPDEIKRLGQRTPFVAHEMLYEYIIQREEQMKEFTLLEVELPFAVPLDPEDKDLLYVGRLDKVFEYRGDIIVGEHKTTSLYSKASGFRNTFIDQFSPNSQVDGYLHALHMLYGDKAKSVWIDGALVHKTVHDCYIWIPIERRTSALSAWLWETRNWISQIEANYVVLDDKSPEGDFDIRDAAYLPTFPKNTSTCQDFARNCPYIDLCKAWPNPIGKDTPMGFVKETWSPFERLELDKIGLENPDA